MNASAQDHAPGGPAFSSGVTSPGDGRPGAEDYVVVHPRRWRSWIEVAIVVAVIIAVGQGMVTSGVVDPAIIGRYIFSTRILEAIWNTMVLATMATVFAISLGTVVALMRISQDRVLSGIAVVYVFIFRGTPMLIQLLFWFNALPVMVDTLHLEIPMTGLVLFSEPTINVVTPFVAALLGLTLAETGYMAEVIRSGILGVDRGQRDAARALGVNELTVNTRIVIPQAFRIVLPALGNQYVMMIKNTSLAYAIGYLELLRVTSDIYFVNFRVMELLVVAAVWYLVLTAMVTGIQHLAERRFPAR